MIERSRTPVSASCSVRGIGVAESVSTCTSARSCFSRSLWLTPKCCSSSTIRRPRSLNLIDFPSKAWVPTTISMPPSAMPFLTLVSSFGAISREACATLTGKPRNRSAKVLLCCRDNGVVGAVARQQFDVLDRQKQLGVGGVVQLKTIMRRARYFECLQSNEAADTVLDMNHEIAAVQARDFGDEVVELPRRLAWPHQPIAENILLADEGDAVGLEAGLHAQHGQHGLVAWCRLH